MSQGVHNLFANPSFVGGLHQDPSSAAIVTEFPTSGNSVRKATTSFTSSSGYASQCYNGNTLVSNLTDKINCVAVSGNAWREGAYGSVTVDVFPEKASKGDQIVFGSSVTAGNYVSSKRTVLTLTANVAASNTATTFTGTFDGPVATNDLVLEHRRHIPQFVSYPINPVVNRDETIEFNVQTSFDFAKHDYYGGGINFRWLMSNNIMLMNPSQIGPHIGNSINNFNYTQLGGDPQIYMAIDSLNGQGRGTDEFRDIVNVIPAESAGSQSTLQLGPFASIFNRQGNDINVPSKRGSYWWCELLLYEDVGGQLYTRKVIQSPVWFLEVKG